MLTILKLIMLNNFLDFYPIAPGHVQSIMSNVHDTKVLIMHNVNFLCPFPVLLTAVWFTGIVIKTEMTLTV